MWQIFRITVGELINSVAGLQVCLGWSWEKSSSYSGDLSALWWHVLLARAKFTVGGFNTSHRSSVIIQRANFIHVPISGLFHVQTEHHSFHNGTASVLLTFWESSWCSPKMLSFFFIWPSVSSVVSEPFQINIYIHELWVRMSQLLIMPLQFISHLNCNVMYWFNMETKHCCQRALV